MNLSVIAIYIIESLKHKHFSAALSCILLKPTEQRAKQKAEEMANRHFLLTFRNCTFSQINPIPNYFVSQNASINQLICVGNSQLQNSQPISKAIVRKKNRLQSRPRLFCFRSIRKWMKRCGTKWMHSWYEEANKNQSNAIRIIVMWRLFKNCING